MTEASAFNTMNRLIAKAKDLARDAEKHPRLGEDRDRTLGLLVAQLRQAAKAAETLRTAEHDERERGWGAAMISFDGTETPMLIA